MPMKVYVNAKIVDGILPTLPRDVVGWATFWHLPGL